MIFIRFLLQKDLQKTLLEFLSDKKPLPLLATINRKSNKQNMSCYLNINLEIKGMPKGQQYEPAISNWLPIPNRHLANIDVIIRLESLGLVNSNQN